MYLYIYMYVYICISDFGLAGVSSQCAHGSLQWSKVGSQRLTQARNRLSMLEKP